MPTRTRAKAGSNSPNRRTETIAPNDGLRALRLAEWAAAAGRSGLLVAASGESHAEGLAALLWATAPGTDTILFPPWDCLPFDRTSPSGRIMGVRAAGLSMLSAVAERPRIVLTTPEALMQRLPPPEALAAATRVIAVGQCIDLPGLAGDLAAAGYRQDERVDETGEFAIRGQVVDIFPAGYGLPVRIGHSDGVVRSIASYHAGSQRTTDEFATLHLRPVSEFVDEVAPAEGTHGQGQGQAHGQAHEPGREHRIPERYDRLVTLLDLMPDATVVLLPDAADRFAAFGDLVADAHGNRLRLDRGSRPLAPERLYVPMSEHETSLARHPVVTLAPDEAAGSGVPRFAAKARPDRALAAFVAHEAAAGRRILIAGPSAIDREEVASRLRRAGGPAADETTNWATALDRNPGWVGRIALPVRAGFAAEAAGVTVIAAADLLGSRTHCDGGGIAPIEWGDEEFRLNDAAIHLQHGVGILRGIETVTTGDADPVDTVRLDYADGAHLMVPADEIGLMWRYGASGAGVTLDKLDGDSWPKRRAKVEREIAASARALAEAAGARARLKAPVLRPDGRAYERFVARFPFAATPDQEAAVAAILDDLSSGRPMDRLVCGDVGFGKTEVALRAAAAAALAGRQVAIVAPTTVLVRQHLRTFERRFADLGLRIGHLSRLVSPAEARATKAGLADGSIRIVIGTHAVAACGVSIPDLGLLVIDEEQHFGAADKAKLRGLNESVHVLTLTATPIPRTLQSALVGLQALSVLATPPAARQPVRTVVTPLDDATVREALLRERRRGGQSFVVCPRIEDIAPLAERLGALVPELSLRVAHGKLPAAAVDATMVDFADGEADVLLATNIIESGLDVPRANTMLLWRPDCFGLSQLHQLRGRVGRGRVRGVAFLLTDPDDPPSPATLKRLATLETFDRLGSGFAISAEDLNQRGAGDLVGDTQAGHVKLIGAGLYRRLLERALVTARGGTAPDEWLPELRLGLNGRIPAGYVPEPEVRLNLYARLARAADREGEAAFAAELRDRFGPPPPEVANLLALARLRRLAAAADVSRIDAGPKAMAFTFRTRRETDAGLSEAVRHAGAEAEWKKGRLVVTEPTTCDGRGDAVETWLRAFGPPRAAKREADKALEMA